MLAIHLRPSQTMAIHPKRVICDYRLISRAAMRLAALGHSIGGEAGRTTSGQCESRQRQGDMGHDTEVRALRQTIPVIHCIGRILHVTDVTHPIWPLPPARAGEIPGLTTAHDYCFKDSSCV